MSLLGIRKEELVQIEKTSKKEKGVGCEHCPNVKNKNKVFGKVIGDKKLFIFGSVPGYNDTEQEMFSGNVGEFLWGELAKVGIKKKDCEVQFSVRCFPATGKPSKDELRCCSVYNEQAIAKSSARVYLLLGSVATTQVLGKEWKKGSKVMWSEKLQAKVYCLYHPNYFLRGTAAGGALEEFRMMLKQMASDLGSSTVSPYGYLEEQDYKGVVTKEEAAKELELIVKKCKGTGRRVSIDLEDDVDENGNKIALCVGTSWKPGRSRVFIIDHPRAVEDKRPLKREVRDFIREKIVAVLEDREIEKVCHHGSYDLPNIEKELECKIRSYTFDTNYSSYFIDPDAKSYGLDIVGMRMCPQFGEYKTIILPECLPEGFDYKEAGLPKNPTLTQIHDYISRKGLMRLGQLPLRKLVLYNGADCDLTKRIEIKTKNVSLPLLRIYNDAAFVLDAMTPNGPVFDFEHLAKLEKIFPPRLEKLKMRLKKKAGRPDFNPGSPKQVAWLLYDKLKILERTDDGKTPTGKDLLEAFSRKEPVVKDILDFRRVGRIVSTYMASYKKCALANTGRLRTKWWLTGTGTGRLSSGGGRGKKTDEVTVVNLQNVINEAQLQNLCVADARWRELYTAIGKAVKEALPEKSLIALKKKVRKGESVYEDIDKLKQVLGRSPKFTKLVAKVVDVYGDIKVVLGDDQGQAEVRAAAQASGDDKLIADCKKGDIHSRVGHSITGWDIEKIKKDKPTRTVTKNVHFGILFGLVKEAIYAYVMARNPDTKMTREEVEAGYDRYFARYKKVKRFIEMIREFAQEHGYVENMFGFRRKINVGEGRQEAEDEGEGEFTYTGGAYWKNQAINSVIQGAAHQLMLMALAYMKRKPKDAGVDVLGVPGMEVHDAMYFWVKLRDLVKAKTAAKYLLEEVPLKMVAKEFPELDWKVPLEVEGKAGFRLGDTVDVEGKDLNQIIVDMFFESFVKECKLEIELESV